MFKKITTAFILLFSLSLFASVEKEDPRDMIRDEIDSFYGKKSTNVLNIDDPTRPNSAIYKKGTCLKFNKEGEDYWTIYETMTLRIEDIGDRRLKVRKLFFMTDKKWLEGSPESMIFENQDKFTKTECPSDEMKLSPEEIEDLRKKNKLKNV